MMVVGSMQGSTFYLSWGNHSCYVQAKWLAIAADTILTAVMMGCVIYHCQITYTLKQEKFYCMGHFLLARQQSSGLYNYCVMVHGHKHYIA